MKPALYVAIAGVAGVAAIYLYLGQDAPESTRDVVAPAATETALAQARAELEGQLAVGPYKTE